jgi:hypothetical protein
MASCCKSVLSSSLDGLVADVCCDAKVIERRIGRTRPCSEEPSGGQLWIGLGWACQWCKESRASRSISLEHVVKNTPLDLTFLGPEANHPMAANHNVDKYGHTRDNGFTKQQPDFDIALVVLTWRWGPA